MRNLAHYYGNERGWSSGPHFFTDEDQVFGLSPVSEPGVHAKSFNKDHIGIEVLGNYDTYDDPKTGRGLQAWTLAANAVAILLEELQWGPDNINYHRDDPRTRKTCPGKKVTDEWFEALVRQARSGSTVPELETPPQEGLVLTPAQLEEINTAVGHASWQINKVFNILNLTPPK